MKGPKRRGQHFKCPYCGDTFYRRPSHVRRGITKTCGKRECISQSAMGANNAFWGKNHSEETRVAMKEHRTAKPPRPNRRGPKGYKHTPHARAAISAALREQWRTNRDKRMAAVAKASIARLGANTEPRYRLQFSPMQRRDWTANECAWCDSTEDLVLDHILPVMAGGRNRRANAQTLCRKCNIWKMRYVDRPLLLAILDNKGAELQPRVPGEGHSVTFETSNGAGEATASDRLL